MLGLCVVGCGAYAATFAQGVALLRDRISLYFASRDLTRAQEYACKFGGAGAFGSYQSAANDPRVDALYVCTPHHLHLEHVRLATQAGKHVLVEKPIARTLDEAQQIINLAQEARVTLMVAENYRFMAPVQECKRLVENGAIGSLRLVQLQEQAPFRPHGWRSQHELNGGGVLIDGGIHKLHFLRYLAGEPDNIYAASLPSALAEHQGEDGMIVVLRWEGGAVGLINHSWVASDEPSPRLVEVSGSAGRLTFAAGESWLRLEKNGSAENLSFQDDNVGITLMVQEFLDSINDNREPETSGMEGLKDLDLVLRAYQSAQAGLPVSCSNII